MTESKLINRWQRRHYANVGTAAAPSWKPIGQGFTVFAARNHPVSYQRRYIHESMMRTDVTGYAPTILYDMEVYTGDPVIARFREIADREYTGSAAWVDICTVDLFDETATSGVYRAFCRTYAVIPEKWGDNTDTLLYSGTLRAVTPPTFGSFIPSVGVFQADA